MVDDNDDDYFVDNRRRRHDEEETSESLRDQFTALLPFIVPVVSPYWFTWWYYRFYAVQGTVVGLRWARRAFLKYRRRWQGAFHDTR